MLWYLANGSLNDYLKSQVMLQSQYYSGQKSNLINANFSDTTGITTFTNLSLANIDGLTQLQLFNVDKISVQLAQTPTQQLDSPSIQKKTTTLVHVQELRFNKLHAWSETAKNGKTNLDIIVNQINTKLATDYPALYPQISAKLYAEMYPERSEKLALEAFDTSQKTPDVETNQAIIDSKKAKQKKRLLGKAITRINIMSVIIDELTLTIIKGDNVITKQVKNIQLGRLGDENGLDSNQLGGELLRRLLNELINIENANLTKNLAN